MNSAGWTDEQDFSFVILDTQCHTLHTTIYTVLTTVSEFPQHNTQQQCPFILFSDFPWFLCDCFTNVFLKGPKSLGKFLWMGGWNGSGGDSS